MLEEYHCISFVCVNECIKLCIHISFESEYKSGTNQEQFTIKYDYTNITQLTAQCSTMHNWLYIELMLHDTNSRTDYVQLIMHTNNVAEIGKSVKTVWK